MISVLSLHTVSRWRNPRDFSRFNGGRKDWRAKSQKFVIRLDDMVSLQYFIFSGDLFLWEENQGN